MTKKATYKRLGDYIRQVDVRNKDLAVNTLVGLTIDKAFIPSVANTIGTDLSNYKVISKGQFACSLMQVSRDGRMPVAMYTGEKAIMSPAYPMFEVTQPELMPEFLMMWFSRSEFDRQAAFYAVGGVRGSLTWEDFCDFDIPVPPIKEQRKIVAEYQAIERRIENNRRLITTLESTAQAIYRHMFIENIDPEHLPQGWRMGTLQEICSKIGSGATPSGGKNSYQKEGISLIRSKNVFDYQFDYTDLVKINEAQASKLNNVIIEKSDVLFNITGVSVTRCCRVPDDVIPARVNQHVLILRPKKTNLSEFIMLSLLFSENKKALLGISDSGSTREAITKTEIQSFPIIIPSSNDIRIFHEIIAPSMNYHDSLLLENVKENAILSLLLTKLSNL